VSDRGLFADAADDEGSIGLVGKSFQIGVIGGVLADGGIFDSADGFIAREPGDVLRLDVTIILDVKKDRDSGGVGESTDARFHPLGGRDPLLREEHDRGEAVLAQNFRLIKARAERGARGWDDQGIRAGGVLEEREDLVVFREGKVVEVGVAAVEQRRHAARFNMFDELAIFGGVQGKVAVAAQRRDGEDGLR
jgi:hypothetical protein